MDIGCGANSPLCAMRPRLVTTGIDAYAPALNDAIARNLHDNFILGDVMRTDVNDILSHNNGERFDVVTLYDVVEHFPKREGFELLERCEFLTQKLVIVQTPNGFLEQGPEYGNELQRHLSGWFAHDFQGLGYTVYGTCGTKWLHGYAGKLKSIPAAHAVDVVLASLLGVNKHPARAFELFAVKDVRGATARL